MMFEAPSEVEEEMKRAATYLSDAISSRERARAVMERAEIEWSNEREKVKHATYIFDTVKARLTGKKFNRSCPCLTCKGKT